MPTSSIQDLSVIHLNLLLNILKHGNGSTAAQELGLSQSSASYHLKKIREIFNDEMFIRTNNGLRPTERCVQIGRVASDLISRIESDLVHAGHFDPESIERELWLAVDGNSISWFPELYQEVTQRLPRLTLCTRQWGTQSFSELFDGTMQFGIHVIPYQSSSVYAIELIDCFRVFVVRDGHYLAKKGSVDVDDLTQFPVLINDLSGWNTNGNAVMEKALAAEGKELNVKGKIACHQAVCNIARESNTIGYIAVEALPADLTGLTILPGFKELNQYQCSYKLYVSAVKYGSQETNWLVDFLSDSFKRHIEKVHNRVEIKDIIAQYKREISEKYD